MNYYKSTTVGPTPIQAPMSSMKFSTSTQCQFFPIIMLGYRCGSWPASVT